MIVVTLFILIVYIILPFIFSTFLTIPVETLELVIPLEVENLSSDTLEVVSPLLTENLPIGLDAYDQTSPDY